LRQKGAALSQKLRRIAAEGFAPILIYIKAEGLPPRMVGGKTILQQEVRTKN
jgi:hypothetical protein